MEKPLFFGREWILSKVLQSLDGSEKINYLIVGGPGTGKTTLCSEISHSTRFSNHVLAYHFCEGAERRTLSPMEFMIGLIHQLTNSTLLPGYTKLIQINSTTTDQLISQQQENELRTLISQDLDGAFKKLILLPLLQIKRPKRNVLLLVDSVDEGRIQGFDPYSTKTNKTIGQLLGEHYNLFPPWLRLFFTARKQGKLPFLAAFRKISLDDQRKAQVVRDVQQFILSRLDGDISLRQHINRETAEMLNQLRIKSNGCFLYLEKVLTGISGNFIVLREITEIPPTLNGLYLWMSQRLFTKKQFGKVKSILSIILSSERVLSKSDIFLALHSRSPGIVSTEDFTRRMYILRRLLATTAHDQKVTFFHSSYAEWLLDVKYCTQRYLCHTGEGHTMLGVTMGALAMDLSSNRDILEFCHHLLRMNKFWADLDSAGSNLIPLLLLCSGAKVTNGCGIVDTDVDSGVIDLINTCILTSHKNPSEGQRSEEVVVEEEEGEGGQGGGEAPCEGVDVDVDEGSEVIDLEEETMSLHEACNEGNVEMLKRLIAQVKANELEVEDTHGRTPLNIAAREGHELLVEELLKHEVDVDHADKDGWTPLRSSAWAGHTGVVNILLDAGAQVDLTDSNGRTALRAAAWGGHDEVVGSLLKVGASPLKADIEGRTPLIAAAYMGHSEICKLLLQAGAKVNHSDSDGRTALSVAALCVVASPGHLEVVKMLLERKAFVNHQDNQGSTPLLVAAFEGQREVTELLLEFEADVDLCDKAARTPLWAAASMGHVDVAELLLFWGAYVDHIDAEGRTVLSVAAAQGSVGVVSLLLARGLDEGHRDNAGWTPLHYAAFEGHDDVCEALIEAGARIGDTDNDGKHALLLAAQEGHLNVVEKLINYGCDLNLHSHDGRTSLRAAAIEGFKDVVQMICSRGGNLDYRDSEGRSTLYLLALENRLGMAHILIRHGADVETRDFEGRTPLHISAWQGHFEMVELLVSAGADVNAVDKDKRSPLQSACWQGHPKIVRLLCERGSDVDHVCSQGATALCVAAQEGFLEIVKILLENGGDPRRSDFYGRTPIRVALKSGHAEISRLLNDAARNKPPVVETTVLDTIQCFNKPDSNSHHHHSAFVGIGKKSNESNCKSSSEGRNYYGFTPSPEEDQPSKDPHSHLYTSPGGNSIQNKILRPWPCNYLEECSTDDGPLSFTQQIQEISRHNSRANNGEGHGRNWENPIMNGNKNKSNDNGFKFEPLSSSQNIKSKSESTAAKEVPPPHSFAFTRDSHMKIILGNSSSSSTDLPPSRFSRSGSGRNGGNGLRDATTVIRSGLIALKAGVMEAAAGGRKSAPLVSASLLAVPLPKKSSQPTKYDSSSHQPLKKETQL